MRIVTSLVLATALAIFGCGDDDGNGNGDGDGGANAGRDGGGNNEFGDGGSAAACKKVDLVFAVDPSGSMTDELMAMSTDVFPGFASALQNVGGGLEDYRIGVIDACPDPANFHTRGESSSDCNFQSGEAWMTSASTALNAEFTCVGDIYKTFNCSGNNDDEQPASAAITALTTYHATGQPNAGFLRNDALMVVVAITDEDEQPAPNNKSAMELYNELVAIKGDVKKMVFLGIGGGSGGCDPGTYGQADESVKLKSLTDLFIGQERGVFWDLCQGRLEDGLTDAMAVIEQACAEFPPIE
jgi:hypothetical protein